MYNTLIDACARCGRMERLPTIMDDMKSHNVKPNLISFSTMLKGHCQNGDIQAAFSILEQMRVQGWESGAGVGVGRLRGAGDSLI